MAAIDSIGNADLPGTAPPPRPHHQRTKSSVLRSFIHRRNNSEGSALPSSVSVPAAVVNGQQDLGLGVTESPSDMGFRGFSRPGRALGELQQNQQDQTPRSPKKSSKDEQQHDERPRSPKKGGFPTLSLKTQAAKEAAKLAKAKDAALGKPKKTKSATNLATFLSRPKSLKNLHKLAAEEEATRESRDKENRTPPSSIGNDSSAPTPIYVQFCSDASPSEGAAPSPLATKGFGFSSASTPSDGTPALKQRPKSFQPAYLSNHGNSATGQLKQEQDKKHKKTGLSSTWGRRDKNARPGVMTAFSGPGKRSQDGASELTPPKIAPDEIDTHLEAMLDRRNIPEHQRYKMRNLNNTIKMEFIRQDWAENQAKQLDRPRSHDSNSSMEGVTTASDLEKPKKQFRVKGLTLSKGGSKGPSSPTKKRPEGTLGRHFRSKSAESVVAPERTSMETTSSGSSSIFSKVKLHQSPTDYVAYLRKVQKPELVEVGKLHKLRLLLRNETVTWTEEFIRQGGMKEVVDLLHRIMKVEWREEHEDALLHENLLCLKALCTTALALQYLHSIQETLFPALIHMIFDPEKKGPSEFTTRNIITSVLFTYIQSAPPEARVSRAQTVLCYLRDPEPKEEERPVSFVMDMRRERPYRVWSKEIVSVTKEVFWIFLHNLNVIALPADKATKGGQPIEHSAASRNTEDLAYMAQNFPQERPPVPAAPYVGGVEWEATNYLASHLDLMNAILACTPTRHARNLLREQLRVSGIERCLGGSLRLCKEKFYGAVHDGLRTWVAAAHEDGWDVQDVRYGPPAESRSPPKKNIAPAPKLEMPKLDFGL
ncbi:uncharacterized protein E0L32_001370 [Thyridium curvatum]|uniref:Formin GTPase-binding domain-containing protein n=1 Tax=Thyridium curvatum TaxID=1093900 RepID=A0A507AQV2_9PEZI|nr:uncharacterized protein E0L32_001370 [Thyridium curvatum]TPX10173.1 hypothetical protein E0L32_001370 [Thyridium curvatum]